LEAKRGYHISLPWNDRIVLNRPVVVGEGQYTLCPMRDGVRVTGGVEFGGLDLPPDYRRIRRLLPRARQSLPGLGETVDREWMGHRPALPDSKPVIGASPRHRGVYFAFGHGHLGLTLSAVTARLVAEMVAGHAPSVPIEPFRIDRF
jgi:D-amino-acid dehydrogenase